MKTLAQLHKDTDRLWLWLTRSWSAKYLLPKWISDTVKDLVAFFKQNQTSITEEDLAREIAIQILTESGNDKIHLEKDKWKNAKAILNDIVNNHEDGQIYINRIVSHIKSKRITDLIYKSVGGNKK